MTNETAIAAAAQQAGITETIHTFAEWKNLGKVVKKGEKAVIKIEIWLPKKNKKKEEAEENAGFFRKTAAFFKESQTKEIKEAEKAATTQLSQPNTKTQA